MCYCYIYFTLNRSDFSCVDAHRSTIQILQVLGHKSIETDHAASHLGRCEGHIALIRSIPLLARSGACLVPNTTLAKTGLSQTDIIRGNHRDKIKDVVHEIASSAHVHAQHCERIMATLPPGSKYGLLPLAPAKLFLKRLQKYDFDIFNDRTLMRSPSLSFVLLKEAMGINWNNNMLSANLWKKGNK